MIFGSCLKKHCKLKTFLEQTYIHLKTRLIYNKPKHQTFKTLLMHYAYKSVYWLSY